MVTVWCHFIFSDVCHYTPEFARVMGGEAFPKTEIAQIFISRKKNPYPSLSLLIILIALWNLSTKVTWERQREAVYKSSPLHFIWMKSSWWMDCSSGSLSKVRSNSADTFGSRAPLTHCSWDTWTRLIKASEIWNRNIWSWEVQDKDTIKGTATQGMVTTGVLEFRITWASPESRQQLLVFTTRFQDWIVSHCLVFLSEVKRHIMKETGFPIS